LRATRHIGLIGGIGPAATEFYYRGLVREASARERVLELTLVQADLATLLRNAAAEDPGAQAAVFVALTERLRAAGAECVAITSNTGHFCVHAFEPRSPLPVLNAIPEVGNELGRRGVAKVGLIGTRTVMKSHLYGGLADFEVVLPHGDALDETHDAYLALVSAGRADAALRETLFGIGAELCSRGAEAVLLGGTDLFLAFGGHEPGFVAIDTAELHIASIARACMA
jgi:aspartate racemase